jgi:hypothetical protein
MPDESNETKILRALTTESLRAHMHIPESHFFVITSCGNGFATRREFDTSNPIRVRENAADWFTGSCIPEAQRFILPATGDHLSVWRDSNGQDSAYVASQGFPNGFSSLGAPPPNGAVC